MRTKAAIASIFIAASFVAAPIALAQPRDDKERAELAAALKGATIPLQRGLAASAKEGKPISAKYEVEHGHLQLSVYTMKDEKFSEVIVDPKTGKVTKAEPITEGDDLAAAKAQRGAMAKAKRSLEAAARQAVKENAGSTVISVMPAIKEGHPVADVTLMKGTDWRTVSEKLD